MSLPNEIEALKALVIKLLAEVEALKAENRELRARLQANSGNSDRPPSSDGLRKKPALPRRKNRKRGGQKGHSGKTLEMVAHPDVQIPCLPALCACGHKLEEGWGKIVERRQVFELPEPRLDVIEYQRLACVCPACKKQVQGHFPEGVNAPVQYGPGVKAFTTMLSVQGCLSFDRIRTLFSDLFGYAINEGTLVGANEKAYRALKDSEHGIFRALLREKTLHADETGMRVVGNLHWMHTVSSKRFTHLYLHPKRGRKAMDSPFSVLPFARNWLVHDCFSSYFGFEGCAHALCGAHLLRELKALQEQGHRWAAGFHAFLLQAYQFSRKRGRLTVALQAWALKRYAALLKKAEAEEPPPKKVKGKQGRSKATKAYNLYARLKKHQSQVLAFAFHEEVPFTNNLAERDLRPCKVKQKMAGCFRTLHGARVYARIQGFISTSRKLERNVFKELREALSASNYILALEVPK